MTDWVQKQMERIHGEDQQTAEKGGPGSGHHGHAGRPGRRGGSVPGKGGGGSSSGTDADSRPLPSGAERFSGTIHYVGVADSTALAEIPNIRNRGGFELNPHAYEYTEGAISFEEKANPYADDSIALNMQNLHLVRGREGRNIWNRYKTEVRGEVTAKLKRMRIKNREKYAREHGGSYVNAEAAKRFVADGYDGWIDEYSSGNIYRIVNLDALNEAYRASGG